MIKSRTHQLIMVLLLACVCAPILASEPNEANIELKFEIDNKSLRSWLADPRTKKLGQGPIKPSHVALLYIKPGPRILPYRANRKSISQILDTYEGQSLSEKQRQFLTVSDAILWTGRTIQSYHLVFLYSVSEEDAKKTVRAYLEAMKNEANKEAQHFLSRKQEYQKEISDIKKELPEKHKQFEAAGLKYKEIKNARYFSSLNDGEVYTKAKDTLFQMYKTLDTLEIELVGIEEKLKSIEQYRRNKYAEDSKKFSKETLDKLDQMYVEQMIELSSAKARQKAAFQIRDREKEFLNLMSQWMNFESEVNQLNQDLEISGNNLRGVEKGLANPTRDMLPPKVYQNKVTIYPVK